MGVLKVIVTGNGNWELFDDDVVLEIIEWVLIVGFKGLLIIPILVLIWEHRRKERKNEDEG